MQGDGVSAAVKTDIEDSDLTVVADRPTSAVTDVRAIQTTNQLMYVTHETTESNVGMLKVKR